MTTTSITTSAAAPSAYQQDPRCPEGQKMSGKTCVADPTYDEVIAQLEAELAQLEREENQAARAAQYEARQRLDREMEAQRLAQEQMIAQRRQAETEQIQKLAIYGIGGLGALTLITLIIMAIVK